MKKLLLFSAFALFFTFFSCTADEYEMQTKKTEKTIDPSKQIYADGPDDGKNMPPPPPTDQ